MFIEKHLKHTYIEEEAQLTLNIQVNYSVLIEHLTTYSIYKLKMTIMYNVHNVQYIFLKLKNR